MTKKIILLRGPAGVGKSTIGEMLQIQLGEGWAFLDIDRLKHVISKNSSEKRSKVSHDVAYYFLKILFQNGYHIIAEEIFIEKYYREVLKICRQHNARVFQFFLSAPLHVLLQRDQDRVVKTKGKKNISKLHGLIQPTEGEIIIDTSKNSLEKIVSMILDTVSAKPASKKSRNK